MDKQFALVVAHNERNFQPSLDCPDGGNVSRLERKDAVIIRLRAMLSKIALRVAVQFVGISNLLNTLNGDLRGQSKLLSHVVVNQFGKVILPDYFCIPPAFRDIVTRLRALFQRCLQRIGLIFTWSEFKIYNQFHSSSIEYLTVDVKDSLKKEK